MQACGLRYRGADTGNTRWQVERVRAKGDILVRLPIRISTDLTWWMRLVGFDNPPNLADAEVKTLRFGL